MEAAILRALWVAIKDDTTILTSLGLTATSTDVEKRLQILDYLSCDYDHMPRIILFYDCNIYPHRTMPMYQEFYFLCRIQSEDSTLLTNRTIANRIDTLISDKSLIKLSTDNVKDWSSVMFEGKGKVPQEVADVYEYYIEFSIPVVPIDWQPQKA